MALVEPGAAYAATAAPTIDPTVAKAHWSRTSGLMWAMLIVWMLASFVVHIFAPSLNTIKVLGFPLGFYMAAQGSLIIFVVMLYVYAVRQNAIDEDLGVQED